MLNFLTGLKDKLILILAFTVTVFGLFLKWSLNSKAKLKKQAETAESTYKTKVELDTFKEKILKKEKQKLQEATDANSKKSKLDRLNDM